MKDTVGFDAEFSFWSAMRNVGADIQKSTTQEDRFEGTDFVVEGLRVDFTLALDLKTHVVPSMTRSCAGFKFAIRTGNRHGKFKEPVVLVGLDETTYGKSYLKAWVLPNLEKKVEKNAQAILDAINDIRWEYEDSL